MSRLELKLKSATVIRDSDGCLGVRPTFLYATDPTGDMFTRPTCDTTDKNTVARATTTLMADPILLAGASIATFVIAVISWYDTLRTGVQDTSIDIKDSNFLERRCQ